MITSTSVKAKTFERKLITKLRESMHCGGSVVRSEKGAPLFGITYCCGGIFYIDSRSNTKARHIVRAIQRAKPFQAIRHRLAPWDSRPVGRMV